MLDNIPEYNFGIIKHGDNFPGFSLQNVDSTFFGFTSVMTVREKNEIGKIVREITGTLSADNKTLSFNGYRCGGRIGKYVFDVVIKNVVSNEEFTLMEGSYLVEHRIKAVTI